MIVTFVLPDETQFNRKMSTRPLVGDRVRNGEDIYYVSIVQSANIDVTYAEPTIGMVVFLNKWGEIND